MRILQSIALAGSRQTGPGQLGLGQFGTVAQQLFFKADNLTPESWIFEKQSIAILSDEIEVEAAMPMRGWSSVKLP